MSSTVAKSNNNHHYYPNIYLHNNANDTTTTTIGCVYTPDEYIIITDQFDFDNIAVSNNISIHNNQTIQQCSNNTNSNGNNDNNNSINNTIDIHTTEHGEYKYLVCADCDYGPIGITYINQPAIFYIVNQKCHTVNK